MLSAATARLPMRDAGAARVGYLEQAAEAHLEAVPHSDEWVERSAPTTVASWIAADPT